MGEKCVGHAIVEKRAQNRTFKPCLRERTYGFHMSSASPGHTDEHITDKQYTP